jgi:hypothetical protein
VAVIGPFMVESLEQVGARRIGGELGMPTPVSSP